MKTKYYLSIFIFLLLFSCGDSTNKKKILSENTGRQDEIILVMDDIFWEGEVGELLRDIFEREISGLPQSEQFFNLVQINPSEFSRFFKTHKNIIFASIDLKDSYTKNKWAKAQIVMYLNCSSVDEGFRKSCNKAFNFINRKELENLKYAYEKGHNLKARKHIQYQFGIDLFLPTEYTISHKEDKVFISDFHSFNENQDLLKYILVYEFQPSGFNIQQEVLSLTDSILKKYILGSIDGSFVQIDHRMSVVESDGIYRGIWTLKNGFMGGPFVLKTKYIEDKIIISLGLVFYPNESKRKHVRTFEAIL